MSEDTPAYGACALPDDSASSRARIMYGPSVHCIALELADIEEKSHGLYAPQIRRITKAINECPVVDRVRVDEEAPT